MTPVTHACTEVKIQPILVWTHRKALITLYHKISADTDVSVLIEVYDIYYNIHTISINIFNLLFVTLKQWLSPKMVGYNAYPVHTLY